jgi:flavin-dependent dehydrogenase
MMMDDAALPLARGDATKSAGFDTVAGEPDPSPHPVRPRKPHQAASRSPMESISRHHDLIIIGGGPAGSTCARFAARQGLDVALFERTGRRPFKRTSAGIFDHTWRVLDLEPGDYPHAMRSPHAFDFVTLKDRARLPDVLRIVAPLLKRHVYFPNRDEFDTWLLHLARKEGASVRHDTSVRPRDIARCEGLYRVRAGREVHTAPLLVGAAGTRCPVYRRYFETREPWPGDTMLLTEVEAPESEYAGPRWASYFGFLQRNVFAWTFVVGDGRVHIGTAAISAKGTRKKDMRFADFIEFLGAQGHLAVDFDPKQHHTSGGSIRMYADRPLSTPDGSCHVVGDAAGLLQRDAYNGITNAILSGRLLANAIAAGNPSAGLRHKLHPFLFQDVLRDMLRRPLPFLRRT